MATRKYCGIHCYSFLSIIELTCQEMNKKILFKLKHKTAGSGISGNYGKTRLKLFEIQCLIFCATVCLFRRPLSYQQGNIFIALTAPPGKSRPSLASCQHPAEHLLTPPLVVICTDPGY